MTKIKNFIGKFLHWARHMKWKWRILILAVFAALISIPLASGIYYRSRDRNPVDYSQVKSEINAHYLVGYAVDDNFFDASQFTVKIIESGVLKDTDNTTFHVVTEYDPFPRRRVHAIIVGSAKATLSGEEIWRDQTDLRIIHKQVMQKNLPIVNTAYTQMTYEGYSNYPGWPYHLNDSWTYSISYDIDTSLQPDWKDTFSAVVVADDAIVEINGIDYQCYKVLHTLTDTNNKTSPGGGIGSTYTEYWYKDYKSIGPVKIVDDVNFKGTETQTMMGIPPQLPY